MRECKFLAHTNTSHFHHLFNILLYVLTFIFFLLYLLLLCYCCSCSSCFSTSYYYRVWNKLNSVEVKRLIALLFVHLSIYLSLVLYFLFSI